MNCNPANVSSIPDKLAEVMIEDFEILEIQVPQEGGEKLCGFFQLMNLKTILDRFTVSYIYEDINMNRYTGECVKQFRAGLYYDLRQLFHNN